MVVLRWVLPLRFVLFANSRTKDRMPEQRTEFQNKGQNAKTKLKLTLEWQITMGTRIR